MQINEFIRECQKSSENFILPKFDEIEDANKVLLNKIEPLNNEYEEDERKINEIKEKIGISL